VVEHRRVAPRDDIGLGLAKSRYRMGGIPGVGNG
jgi:hypothetical protein